MTFPVDNYTPFGYLANPFHRARSWSDVEAGLLRTTDDVVGLGWVEPTARRPTEEASVILTLKWNDRDYRTRSDFNRLGLTSHHHTSRLFSYDWQLDAVCGSLTFALAERDSLVGELVFANPGALPGLVEANLILLTRSSAGPVAVEWQHGVWVARLARSARSWAFGIDGPTGKPLDPAALAAVPIHPGDTPGVAPGFAFRLELATGESATIRFGLERRESRATRSFAVARLAADVCARRRREDDAFYAGAALPIGDWPSSWKRGWVYDLETTRACIFPSGGLFGGEWPSWMISWPRVVVAEGTLDATRFSYADPSRALKLVQTLFSDTTGPNVPCVFQGGEPNMVAKDGTICGTSPAWCLPFHNLWLLYCRTLDRDWLRGLIPRLEGYLDYWLRERIDEDGWIVYKCTWEAGEDCTPRLDPKAEGDEVISRWVRPVELQATVAYSAAVLAKFCIEIGQNERARRWQGIADDYARRTRELWDPSTGRYRDWDKRTGTFLTGGGEPSYWKTDPVRFSALSLAPLVAGVSDADQRAQLANEIEYYDAAPWCLWPSWSFVVAEAASAAGWHEFAGRFARRIVDRVYAANDRRSLADAARPTPGTAPEFWPLDLAEFNGSDGYGWGATTSSLWIRQIFGFQDAAPSPDVSFVLAPSLPPELLRSGRRCGFANIPYRGLRLGLAYEATDRGLMATVSVDRPTTPRVIGPDGAMLGVREDSSGGFRCGVTNFDSHRITLERITD
jgi:hypothetical protein